jgi:hypothetical protein
MGQRGLIAEALEHPEKSRLSSRSASSPSAASSSANTSSSTHAGSSGPREASCCERFRTRSFSWSRMRSTAGRPIALGALLRSGGELKTAPCRRSRRSTAGDGLSRDSARLRGAEPHREPVCAGGPTSTRSTQSCGAHASRASSIRAAASTAFLPSTRGRSWTRSRIGQQSALSRAISRTRRAARDRSESAGLSSPSAGVGFSCFSITGLALLRAREPLCIIRARLRELDTVR